MGLDVLERLAGEEGDLYLRLVGKSLYYLLWKMIEGDIEDQECQLFGYEGTKLGVHTCNTLRHGNSAMSPNFNNPVAFPEALDLSLDCILNNGNAELIKDDILSYIHHCIAGQLPHQHLLENGALFCFPSFTHLESEADSALDILIHANPLLEESAKKHLLRNFKEFHQLNGLFSQLTELLGMTLCQQLVFILSRILDKKLSQFRELVENTEKDWLLPKYDRFWGEEGMENDFLGEFKAYGVLEIEDVNRFAVKEVEELANGLFFSSGLKYLTLKETNGQLKPGVSLMDKFSTLVMQLSKGFFLSMSAMAHQQSDHQEFVKELCLHTSEEGAVVGSDLSKRVKM